MVKLGFEPWECRTPEPIGLSAVLDCSLVSTVSTPYTTSEPFLKGFTPRKRLEGEREIFREMWADTVLQHSKYGL